MDKNARDLSSFFTRVASLAHLLFELFSIAFAPDYNLLTESKPVRRLSADLSPFYATYASLFHRFYATL